MTTHGPALSRAASAAEGETTPERSRYKPSAPHVAGTCQTVAEITSGPRFGP